MCVPVIVCSKQRIVSTTELYSTLYSTLSCLELGNSVFYLDYRESWFVNIFQFLYFLCSLGFSASTRHGRVWQIREIEPIVL